MKLGILVNTDRRLDDVAGIARAAVERGHQVAIFVMDEGVRLLGEAALTGLCGLEGVTVAFCDHSTDQLGCKPGRLPEEIVCGSQYDNAVMTRESDRVIVL